MFGFYFFMGFAQMCKRLDVSLHTPCASWLCSGMCAMSYLVFPLFFGAVSLM